MKKITGIVSEITFQNEDNGFTVMKLKSDERNLPIYCVGTMPTIECGGSVALNGTWQQHTRFGTQFAVESYELIRPTTKKAIHALLSSGLITNIGSSRAQKIIDHFDIKTLDILDNDPNKLLEIPGIGKKILSKIKEAWQKHKAIHELMLFLQEFGISINLATKIYATYGTKAKEVVSLNPYSLIDDIWGVGFKKADNIAQKLGFEHDSYKRIRAGLLVSLQNAVSDGHTYLPKNELLKNSTEILGIKNERAIFSLDQLIEAKQVINEDDKIYLPALFNTEKFVAQACKKRLNETKQDPESINETYIDAWLQKYCLKTGFEADPKQINAIKGMLCNNTFLLTGGPGTGKTTLLQVVVSFFREHNILVSLAAPTGRAAQRMGTISGLKAQTIHRLLEFRPGGKGYRFARNHENQLKTNALIIDEVSMIDIYLMGAVLNALSSKTRLILVGDNNQLPSVGPGNVLSDLIASKSIPHAHLTTIFRQAAQSKIVNSAHQIIVGDIPKYLNAENDNCFFLKEEDPEKCVKTIVDLVSKRLPKKYNFDPIADIQVLSPMHKGVLGTQNLNYELQKVLNTNTRKIIRGDRSYITGDKVMQIRNNYDLGVFNGDIGFMDQITDNSSVSVNFDGRIINYELKELDELVQAYCISVHKSQGCEFKAVIIPCMTQHYIMLQRNLFYTALTRARDLCIFIGMSKAFLIAVNNNEAFYRYSRLSERIAQP